MTPDDAADLLRSTTPAPWDIVEKIAGQIDSIGPIEADSGLVVDRWDAELAAAAPELAQALVKLGEVNERLKDAINLMLEKLNENEEVLSDSWGEAMVYQPEDFGLQEGDLD